MLQLQKNEWEVKVEVANEQGFGNDYYVTFGELADRGYVVKVECGAWPVKFGSVEWTKAVTAAIQVPRPTCADFSVGDKVFHDRDPDGTLFSCGAGIVRYIDTERDTVGVEWNCMWIRSPSVRPYHLIKAAIK